MGTSIFSAFSRLLDSASRGPAAAAGIERRRRGRTPAEGSALLEWGDLNGLEHSEPVHLRDRSAEGFLLLTRTGFRVGHPVRLTPTGEGPTKATVRHLTRAEDGWLIGIRCIPGELRRHDRIPIDERALLTLQSAGSLSDPLEVRITDSSMDGLRIRCPRAIAVDQPVSLEHLGWRRPAAVMHCSAGGEPFELGLRFIGPPQPIDAD